MDIPPPKRKIDTVMITGARNFLTQKRFSLLFDTLATHVETLARVPVDHLYDSRWLKTTAKKVVQKLPLTMDTSGKASALLKNRAAFIKQSRRCERQIRKSDQRPDFIFHLFGMYAPFWESFDIPFSMYLDYTMALAYSTWQPWAPFVSEHDFLAWKDCEKTAYEKATCIFTFSRLAKHSLINDYDIDAHKILTVGASGQFLTPYQGRKKFGNCRILFNASNFERKGGRLVLAAFPQIKQAIPDAELIIIGDELPSKTSEGIKNIGRVSDPEIMANLCLNCDILIAPALCEPYGQLLVEAMNYGVPCIVSNVGGMPEVVDHAVNGLVLDELTSACLAATVIDLLQDVSRLERYSKAARHKVQEQLNWPVIAAKMYDHMGAIAGLER